MLEAIDAAAAVASSTPERLGSLVVHLPADLLAREPREGEWSALQVLQHLTDAESGVFARRFRAFLEGAEDLPMGEPGPPGRSAQELVQAFATAREQNLQLIGTLTEPDLLRVARHPRLGPITLDVQVQEWAAHDLAHVIQAERAVMQPFIAGSGPWRESFSEHHLGG